jgi:hypothetical protein
VSAAGVDIAAELEAGPRRAGTPEAGGVTATSALETNKTVTDEAVTDEVVTVEAVTGGGVLDEHVRDGNVTDRAAVGASTGSAVTKQQSPGNERSAGDAGRARDEQDEARSSQPGAAVRSGSAGARRRTPTQAEGGAAPGREPAGVVVEDVWREKVPASVRYNLYVTPQVRARADAERGGRTWGEYLTSVLGQHAGELEALFPDTRIDLRGLGIGFVTPRGHRRAEHRMEPVAWYLPRTDDGVAIAAAIEKYSSRARSKSEFAQRLLEHHFG